MDKRTTELKTGKHPSIGGTWQSPWGWESDSLPPDKYEIFMLDDDGSTWQMEDFLQHNEVFVNGLNGKSCHSDSYMTVVDFDRMDACIQLLEDTYNPSKKDWQLHTDSWLGNPNMQPPLRMVALTICDKYGIAPGKVDMDEWK